MITTTRSWTDTNRNYVPDCDLGNFGAQDTSATGGDVCGRIDNQFFGQNNPRAVSGIRACSPGGAFAELQLGPLIRGPRQVGERVSVTAGYYFNTGGYFRNTAALSKNRVTDNILVTPSDFETYCVKAPADPRLPDGGGYDVCGLYDVIGAKFGQVQNIVAPSKEFGTPEYRNDFIDFSIMRLGGGGRIGGGLDTGWSLRDSLLRDGQPASAGQLPSDDAVQGSDTIKLNGSLPLPKGFVVAGTLQSLPGPQ